MLALVRATAHLEDFGWIRAAALSPDGLLEANTWRELSLLQVDARFKRHQPGSVHADSDRGRPLGGPSVPRSTPEQFARSSERDNAIAFLQLESRAQAGEARSVLGTSRRWAQIVSGGNEDGNEALFLLDDTRLDAPQGRGLNVVTMGPDCMEMRAHAETFDTWGDDSASERFEAFLTAVPNGFFVLLAAKDDASERLSPGAKNVIRQQLGGVEVDRLTYGDAYSLFAVKGDGESIAERYVSRTEGPATLNFILPTATLPAWRCLADQIYVDAPRPDGAFYVCLVAAFVFYGILAASKLGFLAGEESLGGGQPRKGR